MEIIIAPARYCNLVGRTWGGAVTLSRITHNDFTPELLATIRRKAFARPSESEMVEYLFQRVRKNRVKPNFQDYAFDSCRNRLRRLSVSAVLFVRGCPSRQQEHVLSYQRRVAAVKDHFLRRSRPRG